jgi:hypothetical protein
VTKQKTSRSANGAEPAPGHANFHAAGGDGAQRRSDATVHGHANGEATHSHDFEVPRELFSRAASDDVSGSFVAGTAPSAAVCTTRETCAEAAREEGSTTRSGSRRGASRAKASVDAPGAETASKPPEVPPGAEPLPIDGAEFVEAVHERVDLIELEVRLLKSLDEKIVQRELAYLRELKYGKVAVQVEEEAPRILFNLPRPD